MRILFAIVVIACAPLSAQASYVGSVLGGPSGSAANSSTGFQSAITVQPGDSFSGAVVLEGTPGTRCDFALFKLVFTEPGLTYSAGWSQWTPPFTSGGFDDFSTPSSSSSGLITASTFNDVLAPGVIDVSFENLTDNFGDYFFAGTIVNFTLSLPADFTPRSFVVSFVPDTFADGAIDVTATAGSPLHVSVVPAPGTELAMGIAAIVTFRRRRSGPTR